jgi:hypothetical protein
MMKIWPEVLLRKGQDNLSDIIDAWNSTNLKATDDAWGTRASDAGVIANMPGKLSEISTKVVQVVKHSS